MANRITSSQGFWKPLFLIAVLVAFASLLNAQGSPKPPKYDASTETKLKGTIEEVKIVPGELEGVHFMLKTAGGDPVLVHAAPEKFLKFMEVSYAKGDEVSLTGSQVTNSEGQKEVLAKEIVKDNNATVLRDAKGSPIWVGWKY